MNKLLSNSLLLFFLLPLATLAQTEDELSLRQDMADYFQTIQEKQVDKSITYIYPKLFEQVPKEELISAMNEMYNDPELQINLTQPIIKSIDKILLHEDGKYTKVDYSFTTQITFPELEEEEAIEPADETGEDDEDEFELDFGAFMLEMFQAQFGEENVQYNSELKMIAVNVDSSMLAVWEPAYPDSWKFVENKKSMLTKLKAVVPKPVWKYWKKKS